jgi:hypothetical protein
MTTAFYILLLAGHLGFFDPTEWSFETLRQWCAGDTNACTRRRSRWRFMAFFLRRLLGAAPRPGEAISWLGQGNELQSPGVNR